MFSQFILSILGVLLILGFQNCGKVQFSQEAGQLVAKADTGTEVVGDGDGNTVPDDDTDDDNTDDTDVVADDDDDDDDDDDKKKDKEVAADEEEDEEEEEEDDARSYVCVLAGSGKSVKAAYTNELIGKNGTPSDICMTQNACLNIVSQAFEVKGPEKRGFCPDKNPHVVSMTDAQIQALVD